MFNNIAKKIKVMAKVICFGGIAINVSSFILNVKFAADIAVGVGSALVTFTVGALTYFACSLIVYGLGQYIENSDTLAKNSDILVELTRKNVYTSPAFQDFSSRRESTETEQTTNSGFKEVYLSPADETPNTNRHFHTYDHILVDDEKSKG